MIVSATMPFRYLCVESPSTYGDRGEDNLPDVLALADVVSERPLHTCMSISLVSCGLANSMSILVLMLASSPLSGRTPNMALAINDGRVSVPVGSVSCST